METLSPPSIRWTAGTASRRPVWEPQPITGRTAVLAEDALARDPISMPVLLQRLSLLAKLELPCVVVLSGAMEAIADPSGRLRGCGCSDGYFWLALDSFTLQFQEAAIAAVRLSSHVAQGRRQTSIDLVAVNGDVIAQLRNAPDARSAAIWQDIMDTFDCV